jgi:5-methylcytosine-specific restriction enzyme subunit McrC
MIKVQNIYYMLAYAFQVLNQDSYVKVATEEFEYVSDLLAAILGKGISNQIRRGLGREYINKQECLYSPVGKINISSSLKQQTMIKTQLVCDFDEFTENAYINQILKTTVILLLRAEDVQAERKKILRGILAFFCNVDELDPRRIRWTAIRYHRNNATYKMLINICYLVITGMLLTEQEGKKQLGRFMDDQHMHRLFERFVLEYYRKHYPHYSVSAAQIDWITDDGVIDFLPVMQTDITIEYAGQTLIIDTKYYRRAMQFNSFYDSRTVHSGNLYQIFTYVKNREKGASGAVSGVLLYAKTDEEITPDFDYMMSGNRISVKTLDLNADFSKIELQLDELAHYYLNGGANRLRDVAVISD